MRDSFETGLIYERVDKLRKEKQWTIYTLAKKATVSVSSIYRWRDKKSSPTLYLLECLAEALGVSITVILFDVEKVEFLTTEQKTILDKWNRLNDKRRNAILTVIESYEE